MTSEQPVESPEVAVSEPEPDRWQPVEQPAPAPQPEQPARMGEVGTPAGQLAVGAASVLTLGGLGLYQTVGVLGLVAGGATAAAGAGGYGYYRWRQAHPRRDRRRSEHSTSANRSGGKDLFGTSRSGRRAVFSAPGRPSTSRSATGRSAASGGRTARIPPLAGSPSSRGGKRMTFPAGQTSTRRTDRTRADRSARSRRSPAQTAAHAATAPLRAASRAGKATGQRLAQAGRATRAYASPRLARARTASRLLDERTGYLVSRTGKRIAKTARSLDRRTGGRLSRACRAARPQRIRSLWQTLRRLDGDLTSEVGSRAHPHVSAAWRRLRGLVERFGLLKPHPVTTEQPAQPTSQPAPQPAPDASEQPAPIRTFPMRAPHRPSPRRHFPMSNGSPLITVSADMIGSVSRYLPQDMWAVSRDLDQLNQVPENVAMALRTYTTNLGAAYPIDLRVTQMMGEFYASIARTSAMAQQISNGFRKIHADDIKRRETPRAGEHFWNV